jgi:hypothetical protein
MDDPNSPTKTAPGKTPASHPCPTGTIRVFDGVAGIMIGDTLLTLWRSPARAERIAQVHRWTECLIEANAGKIVACQFLLSSASPPDGPGRKEARRGFKVVAPNARRLVAVPLGNAAWRRLVYTVIRAGVALMGQSRLIKLATNESDAFDHLDGVATPNSPNRLELHQALLSLFTALDVSPALYDISTGEDPAPL